MASKSSSGGSRKSSAGASRKSSSGASRKSSSGRSASRASSRSSSGSRSSSKSGASRSGGARKSSGGTGGPAKKAADDAVERIRELNDRIVENARNAGGTYLDIYERTLKTIVGYQEELAKATPVDWVQRVLEAQATFTREVGNFYASTAREALKK